MESQGLRLREYRGRQHHRGAVLDEEPVREAGPGDAPDEEGEPVVFPRSGCGYRDRHSLSMPTM